MSIKITANDVADYLIRLAHQKGDLITNLKLQKLVYYSQAWYLALYDKSLFKEDFEAWVHGPVQPDLYQRFKKYQWNPISEEIKKPKLSKKIENHLTEVFEIFIEYSAYLLEQMVHQEGPWQNARVGLSFEEPSKVIIAKDDMKLFYKSLKDGN